MRTRLSVFCDKVIEAGWLAAVIIVPLFFNIYSQRVFEPDKLSLLRSIALVMCVAWIIRAIEDWRTGKAEEKAEPEGPPFWRKVYKTPMVLPTLLLVLVYLISTAMSVAPRVSFLGSYQRLQGTYTTLSYVVVFFMLLQGLRTKQQFSRLITVMILVSFPIAMYGIVQHFGLDPLPWGGDVERRVASNMGNAIFVAAFLIMVVPLTLSRLIENWQEVAGDQDRVNIVLAIILPLLFAVLVGFSWILELFFPPAKDSYFWMGLLASFIYVLAMVAFAYYLRKPVSRLLLLAGYSIILIVQVACIFYTQSRGPLLGLLGGVFFYFALLGLIKRQVWLPWVMGVIAAGAIVFLVMFNTVESPLMDKLREMPYVGRLGQVLQTEEGTGKVRLLIWEGVVNMIDWHDPLDWPGEDAGQDAFNALRPIIGYGPETMYVAYNRFYPPDLAHYEKRNASPDRSHNETFDALVITGGVGFAIYMLVFVSVLYHGLKWLGLVRNRWQALAFAGLWIGGGVVGAVVTWVWRGVQYVGVGIPIGVLVGVAVYLAVFLLVMTILLIRARLRVQGARELPALGGRYSLWTLALLSVVVAHFIEIHFGIAIAATRTYFWVSTAMLVVLGIRLAIQPAEAEAEIAEAAEPAEEDAAPTRRRRRRRRLAPDRRPKPRVAIEQEWQGSLLLLSLVAILILSTMLFDFVTIQQGSPGVLGTLWKSLTVLRGEPKLPVMLALVLVTWAMIGLVGLSDLATREQSAGKGPQEWLKAVGIVLLISFLGVFFFGVLHAVRLKPVTISSPDAPNPLANTITFYYIFCFTMIASMASVFAFLFPYRFRRTAAVSGGAGMLDNIGVILSAVLLLILSGIIIFTTNVSIVRADILYKQGLSSEKAQNWDGAIFFYDKAVEVAENEDFYYLFLGRAYMEKGKASGGQEQEILLSESRNKLQEARKLAPLNTDHSANLARLLRTWGGLSKGEERTGRLNRSLVYYADATSLSPHNAQLFNEWGQTYYSLQDYERTLEKYDISLSLDQEYVQTYLLLAEFHMRQEQWDQALEAYRQAAEVKPKSVEAWSGLGYIYTQLGDQEGD
jgi:tetratricopeptide (TPR) repeat protein